MPIHGFYKKAEVCRLTTFSPTTLWRRIKDGSFPAPITISKGRVAWSRISVDSWITSKIGDGTNSDDPVIAGEIGGDNARAS